MISVIAQFPSFYWGESASSILSDLKTTADQTSDSSPVVFVYETSFRAVCILSIYTCQEPRHPTDLNKKHREETVVTGKDDDEDNVQVYEQRLPLARTLHCQVLLP